MFEIVHPAPDFAARQDWDSMFVPAEHVAEARKALEKLAAKARRYGNPDIVIAFGPMEVRTRVVTNWDGSKSKEERRGRVLIITGEAPRIGPYEFLARVDPTEAGNVLQIVPAFDGQVDQRFRTSGAVCEHCNKIRARRDCYVVRNTETGEQRQIGSTCLRDYMGIDSPAKIANRFTFWEEVSRGGWMPAGDDFAQGAVQLLALANVCVRLFGWCSKGEAMNRDDVTATASYVSLAIRPLAMVDKAERPEWHKIRDAITPADTTHAEAVITWARTQAATGDYMENLRTVLGADVIRSRRHLGLAVSAISAHARAMELELKRTRERAASTNSTWVGTEGERLRGLKVTQTAFRAIGGNDFGDLYLIKFMDDAGNVFSWMTGNKTGLDNGASAVIDGTVKQHREYQGAKETALTRVKVKAA